jgi:hypothetical protein
LEKSPCGWSQKPNPQCCCRITVPENGFDLNWSQSKFHCALDAHGHFVHTETENQKSANAGSQKHAWTTWRHVPTQHAPQLARQLRLNHCNAHVKQEWTARQNANDCNGIWTENWAPTARPILKTHRNMFGQHKNTMIIKTHHHSKTTMTPNAKWGQTD